MYKNLKAEMARHDVKNLDIAKTINKDPRTVTNKITGVTEFTIEETFRIKDTFFPKLELEYLFEQTE